MNVPYMAPMVPCGVQEVAEGSIKSALNVPSSVFKSEDKSQLDAVIKEQLAGAEQVRVCADSVVGSASDERGFRRVGAVVRRSVLDSVEAWKWGGASGAARCCWAEHFHVHLLVGSCNPRMPCRQTCLSRARWWCTATSPRCGAPRAPAP